ncbi:MAG: DUF1269 domain-containing protein [Actinomycetia bacterium]|nr:DUF1269 domain-containing protein [Actinomycetes bacterium]
MDTELVVLYFESSETASGALDAVRGLEAQGFLELDEAAIMTRDEQGWVTAKGADPGAVPRAASFGGVVGLVVGGVMGLPVMGLLAGAGLATRKAAHADQLEELISSVGRDMTAGSAALVLSVARMNDLETVIDRLQGHREGLLRADVPEELRAEIDRHRPG